MNQQSFNSVMHARSQQQSCSPHVGVMASGKCRAMTAALRYGTFADAEVYYEGRFRWVRLSALQASKRRFSAFSEAEMLEAMDTEVDAWGRPRFMSMTDHNEVVWVRSRDDVERTTGL